MPESYPAPPDRHSPAPPKPTHGLRTYRQFSLAELLFWLTMAAAGAGVVKVFLDRGHRGVDYLLAYTGLGLWLGVTWIAVLLRVYAPRRWKKAAALRREMEHLVQQRRAGPTQDRPPQGESAADPMSPG